MGPRVRVLLATAVVLLVAAVPLLYSSHRQTTFRNVRVVEDGVLYRSGQLSPAALDRVIHDYGIRTVVTLRTVRDPAKPYPDEWERGVCEARGLKHVRIVPKVWGPDEMGEVPAEQVVQAFLKVMDDPANHPVLVHCFAGVHRTGTLCAIYRMDAHGWPVGRAMAEMHACGYDPDDLHPHVRNYLESYRPWGKRDDR